MLMILYLQGDAYESCMNNILDTFNLLRELGFCHSPRKLSPSQEIIFQGFVISSKKMTLTLTYEKKIKKRPCCLNNVISLGRLVKI